MVILKNLPELAIINGFKGTIDFYLHDGIPIARSWPSSPGHDRAPAVEAGWPAFTWAAKNWNSLSPYVQDAHKATSASTHVSGRDMFVRGYITDYFRAGQWSPRDTPLNTNNHFAVLDVQQSLTFTGYHFVVTTSSPCHLYMYWTDKEPWTHPVARYIRGLRLQDDARWCFVDWHENEQLEDGDTLIHTFYKPDWAICETRWCVYRATFAGEWSPSVSPIFKKHRVAAEYFLYLTEPWTWLGVAPPLFPTNVITEPWSS